MSPHFLALLYMVSGCLTYSAFGIPNCFFAVGVFRQYLLLRSYKEQLESALGEPGEGDAEMATDPDILLLNQTITEVLATGMQVRDACYRLSAFA